jgi:hypothetical protein
VEGLVSVTDTQRTAKQSYPNQQVDTLIERAQLHTDEAWFQRCLDKGASEAQVIGSMRRVLREAAAALTAVRERERRELQAWLDAERFDSQYGVHLPGDSALAVLLNSAEERLALFETPPAVEGKPDA